MVLGRRLGFDPGCVPKRPVPYTRPDRTRGFRLKGMQCQGMGKLARNVLPFLG
jgi:hypothetical protein